MTSTAPTLRSPLCVALDGSIVRTDMLHEALLLLVKRNVLYVFLVIGWLLKGRAVLESEVVARTKVNPAALPYNEELLDWLRSERCKGRPIWLFSTAGEHHAEAVAAHLGIFDGVVATDATVRRHLASQFRSQLPQRDRYRWRAAVRALRPHQWAKNVLLLIPLLAAHRVGDPAALVGALLGFGAFSLCASSVYVLNDMLDLEADRQHPRKCRRPFASGDLPLHAGFWLVPALLAAATAVAWFLPPAFRVVLGCYYCLTLAYSLNLKRLVIIDTTVLAALYTLRVIAGAAASQIALSFWLLLFSAFFFLSLAFVKRYAELESVQRRHEVRAPGRGYDVSDLPMLEGLGIAAGYMSVLVMALYINSPAVAALYHNPQLIWPLCALLLYWMSRIWMKTHRGRMHDDPVIFALRDRVSIALGSLCAACVYAAI